MGDRTVSADEFQGIMVLNARWQVREYLEIDAHRGTVRLLRREGDDWVPTEQSAVLGFGVERGALVAGDERLAVPRWAD